MGTLPEWLMLVAVVLVAAAVAWLAWQTRRSLIMSQTFAKIANSALELARKEETHSRQLAAEAIRSRMDSRSPTITIVPNAELRVVNEVELPVRFPRDDHKALFVAVSFTIVNDSPTTVLLRHRTVPAVENGTSGRDSTILAPGERKFVPVQVTRPLAEWRAVADGAAPGDDAMIIFSFTTTADDGVDDEYPFRLVGSPLRPLEGEDDAYDCSAADQVIKDEVRVVVEPRQRSYYLSRRHGLRLPSPEMLIKELPSA